jgi:integrase
MHRQRDPVSGLRWLSENPAEDVERPRRPARQVPFPTDQEIARMLVALSTPDTPVVSRALGIMGAFAGMRRNEIIMLRWANVDYASGLLYVWGKSRQPRPIPMHPRIRALLNGLPREDGQEMVFPSPYEASGQERSPFAARQFNAWLRAAGFAWTHHALRRWFNDRLRRSTTLSDAARRLVVGHEDEATNRLYQNPQAEEARPFVEALEP